MDSSQYLELSLAEIRQGDIRFKDVLTIFFLNSLLSIPVRTQTEFAEGSRVRPASFRDGKREVIPVFTSSSRLSQWDSAFDAITVYGSDLVLMIDAGVGLSLDPVDGVSSGFQFLPMDIQEMRAEADHSLKSAEKDFKKLVKTTETRRSLKSLAGRLSEVLGSFTEVRESYLEEIRRIDQRDGPISEAVVGILADELLPERRFEIISSIASISRDVFGEAGAILVYDDLASSQSRSWELFNAKAPFYVKEDCEMAPEQFSNIPVERYAGPVYVTIERQEVPSEKQFLFKRNKKLKLGGAVINKLRRIRRDILTPGW